MIFLVFVCFGCYGQDQVSPKIVFNDIWHSQISDTTYRRHYDTVKVVMLCADTSKINVGVGKTFWAFWIDGAGVGEKNTNSQCYWMYGYIVREILTERYWTYYAQPKYFDTNKQPIKESVIIFQTIQIK